MNRVERVLQLLQFAGPLCLKLRYDHFPVKTGNDLACNAPLSQAPNAVPVDGARPHTKKAVARHLTGR